MQTNLVVVYAKHEEVIKVATAYPCSNVKREIRKKKDMQCPLCGNYTFNISKIFSEESESGEEFIIKGECLICKLELIEEEMKTLSLIK